MAGQCCRVAEDDDLCFGQFDHGWFHFLVIGRKGGGDRRHQVIVAVGICADDHMAIVITVQIGERTQQAERIITGGESFDLQWGGSRALFI